MDRDATLLPGRLLRGSGPPVPVTGFTGIEIHDPRLEAVLSAETEPVILHQFTLHGEGTVWDTPRGRLVWSDVPNRRLLGWYPDGRVEVVIDNTQFMNGNTLDEQGRPAFIGSGAWVRTSAWIWDFSSTESATAWAGGST